MNIALIAHDKKKELMVQFCLAYKSILKKHNLIATEGTGVVVREATGLDVNLVLPGSQGGDQQIAARVSYNEIDIVLFFRDPLSQKINEPDVLTFLRGCDGNNIPFASNIATAEVLILGLERGDLAWRDNVNPKNQ